MPSYSSLTKRFCQWCKTELMTFNIASTSNATACAHCDIPCTVNRCLLCTAMTRMTT